MKSVVIVTLRFPIEKICNNKKEHKKKGPKRGGGGGGERDRTDVDRPAIGLGCRSNPDFVLNEWIAFISNNFQCESPCVVRFLSLSLADILNGKVS